MINPPVKCSPPASSTCAVSDRNFHCTVPVWKVWLLALMEMLSTFRPTDPHSNFQEIEAQDDPSFRVKYTCKVEGKKGIVKNNSVENSQKFYCHRVLCTSGYSFSYSIFCSRSIIIWIQEPQLSTALKGCILTSL